jgi:hypothetical protein
MCAKYKVPVKVAEKVPISTCERVARCLEEISCSGILTEMWRSNGATELYSQIGLAYVASQILRAF